MGGWFSFVLGAEGSTGKSKCIISNLCLMEAQWKLKNGWHQDLYVF